MKIFQPGEKYELIFSAYPRAGSVAGSVEILSVDRVPESEMQFLECGSKESFYAHCAGEPEPGVDPWRRGRDGGP